MKIDNIELLESFFLPEYKDRFGRVMFYLLKGKVGEARFLIEKQVTDLNSIEEADLSINLETFVLMLLTYKKALINRMKVFQIEIRA